MTPKTITIDSPNKSVYITFSNKWVEKTTVWLKHKKVMVNLDWDKNDNIIGIEILGLKKITMKEIETHIPRDLGSIDLENAELVTLDSFDLI